VKTESSARPTVQSGGMHITAHTALKL